MANTSKQNIEIGMAIAERHMGHVMEIVEKFGHGPDVALRGCLVSLASEVMRALDSAQSPLEQIAIVCTDNMSRDCNHRMALDFIRQIANDQIPKD